MPHCCRECGRYQGARPGSRMTAQPGVAVVDRSIFSKPAAQQGPVKPESRFVCETCHWKLLAVQKAQHGPRSAPAQLQNS